jgi:hypothetical protein
VQDVDAESVLDLHADLRGEQTPGAVEVRAELRALLAEPAQLGQAEDLEAAGVRENGPVPRHEPVESAHVAHQLVAGTQEQVIRIGEDDLGARGRRSSGPRLLTLPCVATGMKAGVSRSPCGVAMSPRRAAPSLPRRVKRTGAVTG